MTSPDANFNDRRRGCAPQTFVGAVTARRKPIAGNSDRNPKRPNARQAATLAATTLTGTWYLESGTWNLVIDSVGGPALRSTVRGFGPPDCFALAGAIVPMATCQ